MNLVSKVGVAALVGVIGVGLAAQTFAQEAGGKDMNARFEALDTNGDGLVTAEEIRAAAALKFAEADTNSDGVLDRDELLARATKEITERAENRMDRMIAWADVDGDGALNMDELPDNRMGQMFIRADIDGDGAISAEEFEQAKEKRGKGKRGMGKHGKGHGGHGKGSDKDN